MKPIIFLTLALLCGCERKPAIWRETPGPQVEKFFTERQYELLTNALATATNLDDVLPVLAGEVDAEIILNLSHASPSELYRQLDRTTRPGSTYTRRQVILAMEMHNTYPQCKRVDVPKSEPAGE